MLYITLYGNIRIILSLTYIINVSLYFRTKRPLNSSIVRSVRCDTAVRTKFFVVVYV